MHVVQLVIEADGGFLLPHRLEVGIDRVGAERRMTEVDRSADERARACRRAARAVDQVRPVEGVERVVVLEPLVAAERAARQLQLEDVVEDAPGAEHLRAAVALDVVGEAEARRQLVGEAELDAELGNVRRRSV